MKKLFAIMAMSSLVALGACAGGDDAAEDAAMDTTVQEVAPPPAPMPTDSMAVDTTAAAAPVTPDTTAK